MTKNDIIEVEILPDGTFKVTTDKVSQPNHLAADSLLKFMAELAGGKVTRTKRNSVHSHVHKHEEEKA